MLQLVPESALAASCTGQGSTWTIHGEAYELTQFHFHMPSEHTIDGKHAALEMHAVYRGMQSMQHAVFGVVFPAPTSASVAGEEKQDHVELSSLWSAVETGAQQVTLNVEPLMECVKRTAQRPTFVSYTGSLTTPPCTEGVQWVVAQAQHHVSQRDLDRYAALAGNATQTNRPVQTLAEHQLRVNEL